MNRDVFRDRVLWPGLCAVECGAASSPDGRQTSARAIRIAWRLDSSEDLSKKYQNSLIG